MLISGASRQQGFEDLQLVFLAGIAIHKLPEGLALGGILRAAMDSPVKTLLGSVLAQSMALAGFAAESVLAPYAGPRWLGIMLGLAGGTFLYLGYHALESVYQQRAQAESGIGEGLVAGLEGGGGNILAILAAAIGIDLARDAGRIFRTVVKEFTKPLAA